MVENVSTLSPDAWLSLGIPGAALFIVLIVVMLMFNQQSKSVGKLCEKIDSLVSSFSENSSKLNEVIITNDKDQKELIRMLGDVHSEISDMYSRVVRIDSRMYDFINKNNNERSTINEPKKATSEKE